MCLNSNWIQKYETLLVKIFFFMSENASFLWSFEKMNLDTSKQNQRSYWDKVYLILMLFSVKIIPKSKMKKKCVGPKMSNFKPDKFTLSIKKVLDYLKVNKSQKEILLFPNVPKTKTFQWAFLPSQYAQARCYPKKKVNRFWLQIQKI